MVVMETVKCPKCESPLKLLTKGESFEGWRKCHKCEEITHIIASHPGEFSSQSLREILDKLKDNEVGIQTLQFILDSGTAQEKDIFFCVGKKSQTVLDLLVNLEVLERNSKRYKIKKPFKEYIQEYIEDELREKSYNKRKMKQKINI